jgi:glyoxylase-like metal-dependent hydrolase (beta-lactamase superfamily II)
LSLGSLPSGRRTSPREAPPGRVGPFELIATPGHAADHVAFVLGDICFCGDLVLGEGSSIVPPSSGGGSLADYLASLEVLAEREFALLLPGHGPPIADPAAKIAALARATARRGLVRCRSRDAAGGGDRDAGPPREARPRGADPSRRRRRGRRRR